MARVYVITNKPQPPTKLQRLPEVHVAADKVKVYLDGGSMIVVEDVIGIESDEEWTKFNQVNGLYSFVRTQRVIAAISHQYGEEVNEDGNATQEPNRT